MLNGDVSANLTPPAVTICCTESLTSSVVFHLVWHRPQDTRSDRLDELFPLEKPQPDTEDVPPEERFEVFMPNVVPIRCHSHNDYWRRTPLYAAVGSGCISIEADVWAFEDDLFVGHNARALTPEVTLSSTYLDPIEKLLHDANQPSKIGSIATDGNHGVFNAVAEQTLVLLIDFKTESSVTYHRLYSQLSSLRNKGWLTHWNGTDRIERPLTIVVSGNVPFDEITANKTYRDIFADAPLGALDSLEDSPSAPTDISETFDNKVLLYKYNPSNSYYSSMDIKKIVGLPLLTQYSITPQNIQALKDHIHAARVRGLVPRFWGTPIWPRNFRDYTWGLMMELGVGVLNVDDLRAVRMGNWGRWSQRREVNAA